MFEVLAAAGTERRGVKIVNRLHRRWGIPKKYFMVGVNAAGSHPGHKSIAVFFDREAHIGAHDRQLEADRQHRAGQPHHVRDDEHIAVNVRAEEPQLAHLPSERDMTIFIDGLIYAGLR